jgi:23S rRNA (uracil1939-C5)-methyltransferase
VTSFTLLEPGSLRLSARSSAPGCPHAPTCPGCPLINEPYARGVEHKAERLGRALLGYPELAGARIDPFTGADVITHYRLRAKLVADARGRLGLFEAGSHDVVDTPDCRILEPAVFDVASALRALLPLDLPLRGVDLRRVDRGVLVCLIVEGRPAATVIEAACERIRRGVPHLAGLAVSFTRPDAVQLLGPEQEILHGVDAEPHHFSAAAPWHFASHGAFTQVHAGQTARLHDHLERLATQKLGSLSGRRVLELYAGSGALALRLAARGAQVTAVEAFAPALERLSRAASAQSLRVETRAADAELFLRELTARAPASAPFELVLVNPPRRGLAPGVRSALAALAPQSLLYVSCEPETMARDLSHFASLGWGATTLAGFDMIPLSEAVEAVAALEPSRVSAPKILFEDERSLALFKSPFESTAGEGGSRESLLERAQRSLGVGELTPLYRLEVGTSGVCWFARRAADVDALARTLEAGSLTYTALAMGVSHKKGKLARPLREGRQLRKAVTRYTREAVVNGHSLLELRPEHGRRYQLHRHLASIGHPILGDADHGHAAANRHFEHRHGLDRPFLHCTSLHLELGAGPVAIRAQLPGDLAAVLASLRGGAEAR